PAPTVSGKCAIGERPFTWVHEMPDAEDGTCTKAGVCSAAKLKRGMESAAPVASVVSKNRLRDNRGEFQLFDFT
ncbi:MAG TPA: hypothetical protein VF447_00350, partial [Terriglobales bacterium]